MKQQPPYPRIYHRDEAKRRGVPYQTLIKVLLERSLDRLGAA